MSALSDGISRRAFLRGLGQGALAAAAPLSAFAQAPSVKLDVPYVPTPQEIVDRMLEIARVTKDDYVMDLGCGDGRMLVTAAAKYGARGYGVDINPVRIREANANAKTAKVEDMVKFEIKDLFKTPIEQASVLTMYLLPSVMLQLRPRILADMKPGSRIVSHDFHFDDWEPDYQETSTDHDIFHWIVPGRAEGLWSLKADGETYTLSLRQKFQKLEGRISTGKRTGLVREGRVEGNRLRFNAVFPDGPAFVFSGSLDANGMRADGAAPPRVITDWSAARSQ